MNDYDKGGMANSRPFASSLNMFEQPGGFRRNSTSSNCYLMVSVG